MSETTTDHYIWCPADGRCGCGADVTGHDAEGLRARADAAQASTPIWAAVLRAMAERREPAVRRPRKRAATGQSPVKRAPRKPKTGTDTAAVVRDE